MRRWQIFSALCSHLRSGILGGRRSLYPRATWKELTGSARSHIVVPSLSWCLRDEKSIPPETRSFLDAVLRLNGKRNDRLCRQLEQIAGALNRIDVEPTLLKGAAHLVGELYPSPAARLMSDLDILVPQERARDAFAAMEAIGFALDEPIADTHHHLPLMRHVENDICIELHTRLLHETSEPIVPVSWVHEQSQSIAFRGHLVRMPSPTIMIAHNVVHDQFNHERYAWKQIELRQLLDFALLRARHEQEIDWTELDRRFRDVGLGHVLATYLQYGKVLLGQPLPAIRSAPRKKAVHRLRQAMEFPLKERPWRRVQEEARKRDEQEARNRRQAEQETKRAALRAERLARRQARQAARQRVVGTVSAFFGRWTRRFASVAALPWHYVKERRRDPAGLARLADPQAWWNRFRLIARNLKELR